MVKTNWWLCWGAAYRDGSSEDAGDWLEGSGWVEALVQAEIATPGSADSFLRAAHITHTKRAHQITAAALYILQKRAYNHFCLREVDHTEYLPKFNAWCKKREEDTPLFQYWATGLELELLKTRKVFSSILIDQAHEHNNTCIKGDEGDVGLTNNPSAQCVIEELGNPFEEESLDLVALHTKEIASPSAAETVRNAKSIGQDQFQTFTRERLMEGTKPADAILHRNKLKVFSASISNKGSKGKEQLASLKHDASLFSQLYIGCQKRDGNPEEFFCHENQARTPALSDGGNICLCMKSDLLACLGDLSVAQTEAPPATSVVLDGVAVLQMLKPAAAKNFEEYAQEVLIPYMSTKLQTASRLDLVFDRHIADSLKCTARAKRGQGVRKCVVGSATIPRNWQNFLRVDSNKTELFKFLFDKEDKQLVITDGQAVLSKPVLPDLASIAPCNHEEADSHMLQHTSHAAQYGHHKILIQTVDTDVVVLAVSVVQGMHQEGELWLAFGTGKSFRYLAAHEMAAFLGPEKARALPIFHALTGCDTVSIFSGHGKKDCLDNMGCLPRSDRDTAEAFCCIKSHTRGCHAHHREVRYPPV
ncbi:hypothetical protein Hamer_G002176 [Homarus americanus]|uniref:Uncharacterized protein n=1 Tax=Homarus americanus TaxID=6706 RepID=A0A8J5MTN9_HOMAM|nr:hypothetical protein Hamer_G002176 [Homarus americanus]